MLAWDTSQLYTTGMLTVIGPELAGDFNGDAVVDSADYVVWRKGLGTTYTQDDYVSWRANFGQTVGSGAKLSSAELMSATVPEPMTLVLLTVAAAGWYLRQRRAA
jgi:hypothetical protein